MKQALKYLVAVLLTAGLLYLAFRGQNLKEATHAMEQAHWLPLFASLVLMFLSHAVRALRWQIVLRPVKARTSFWTAFKATLAGYGMNNIIPRSGEIVRPYLLARKEEMPMAGVLATVVVERLTDVLALAALIGFSLAMFREPLTGAFPMLSGGTIPALIVMLAVLFLFVAFFFSERRTRAMMRLLLRPFPAGLREKITALALEFSQGLRGLDKRALLPLFLGTTGIWILYGLSMWVSLQAFDTPQMSAISIPGAFVILTLSGISFTVPTPGASGTYHFFISQGLSSIFGVPMEFALAYAIITHATSYISITLVGLGILVREGVSFGKVRAMSAEETPASIPPTVAAMAGE